MQNIIEPTIPMNILVILRSTVAIINLTSCITIEIYFTYFATC